MVYDIRGPSVLRKIIRKSRGDRVRADPDGRRRRGGPGQPWPTTRLRRLATATARPSLWVRRVFGTAGGTIPGLVDRIPAVPCTSPRCLVVDSSRRTRTKGRLTTAIIPNSRRHYFRRSRTSTTRRPPSTSPIPCRSESTPCSGAAPPPRHSQRARSLPATVGFIFFYGDVVSDVRPRV